MNQSFFFPSYESHLLKSLVLVIQLNYMFSHFCGTYLGSAHQINDIDIDIGNDNDPLPSF